MIVAALAPGWTIRFGPFDDEVQAREYLQTLWQVVAASVGVSVAVIAFVLQAFLTSAEQRHGGTLKEFAHQTKILWLFDLAAVALAVDGLALAEVGGIAPAGWPGLAASVLSGVTLLALLVGVPRAILYALEPTTLLAMRGRTARGTAARAVREQLLGQLAQAEIMRTAGHTGVTRGIAPDAGQVAIAARRRGVVHDIDLERLSNASTKFGEGSRSRIGVLVDLEQPVQPGTDLLALPRDPGPVARWHLRRAIKIRRRPVSSVALSAVIARLKQHALSAVRRGDDVELRDLTRVVEDVLLELPRATRRHDVDFAGAVGSPGLFGYGPAGRAFDVLHDALTECMDRGTDDLAETVLYTPYSVASGAADLRAPALIGDAAGYYVAAYVHAARRVAGGHAPVAEHVHDSVVDQLASLIDAIGGHALAFDTGLDLASAETNLNAAFGGLQQLLRAIVRGRDERAFARALHKLDETLEGWDAWSGERAEAQNRVRAELAGMRLALAGWAMYLLMSEDDGGAWPILQSMTERLLDEIPTPELVTAYRRLGRMSESLGSNWSLWFYEDEVGGVQSLDADSHLADAFILAIARRIDTLEFPPEEWLGRRHEQLDAAADRIDTDRARVGLAASVDFQRVRDALHEIRDSEQRAEAARTRAAPLDPAAVALFVDAVNSHVDEGRVLRDMLKIAGRWSLVSAPEWPDRETQARLVDKRFYIGAPGFVGQDRDGQMYGRQVALQDLTDLVELFRESCPGGLTVADARAAITAVIAEMREEGYEPSIVLCPTTSALFEHLGLTFGLSPDALDGTLVLPHHTEQFRGVIDGVPVAHHPDLSDSVLVVDLARAVRMEERATPAGTGVVPVVRDFDADAARRLLREQPSLRSDDRADQEDVEHIQERVMIHVTLAWRLFANDPSAARAIPLSEELLKE